MMHGQKNIKLNGVNVLTFI